MTREIKFRAWDGEKKELHYWTLNDLLCRFGNKEYSDDCTASPFFDWMQYTGLKDKNGKEIYEGDIVAHHTDKRLGVVEWKDAGYIINEGKNWVEKIDSWCYPLDLKGDIRGEVIGNIYENPELLK